MRKALRLTLAGLCGLLVAGTAAAASQRTQVMNVPLPDGSTARIEYVGEVAPKVTVNPSPLLVRFPEIGPIHRSMFDMQRRIEAMIRNMRDLAPSSVLAAPTVNVAGYGDMPAGTSSVTIVTTSDGTKTCTRRTEVTSQGPGRAPKVESSVSGHCGPGGVAPQRSDNRV